MSDLHRALIEGLRLEVPTLMGVEWFVLSGINNQWGLVSRSRYDSNTILITTKSDYLELSCSNDNNAKYDYENPNLIEIVIEFVSQNICR